MEDRNPSMRRYRKYLIALALVAVWGVFSCAYLGVEDGSSGLSPFGWLAGAFFVPGGLLLEAVKEMSRKSGHVLLMDGDLLLAAALSFCIYAVVVVLAVKSVASLRRALCGK
ncbi:MAG: hypothetical protein ABFE01_20095 [Phycisphaerales bacterium]